MDEGIYLKNMNAINRTKVYGSLRDVASTGLIRVERAKNGLMTMRYQNKYVHSAYDPAEEAERLTSGLKLGTKAIAVCFGMAMAHHIRALIKRMEEGNVIIVIEPSQEIFLEAIKNDDLSDIFDNERVIVMVGPDMSALSYAGEGKIREYGFSRSEFFALPFYAETFPDIYRDFLLKYREISTGAVVSLATEVSKGPDWNRTFFSNLPFLSEACGISAFKDAFAGKTCVIAAAGPSLNKNVELLREIQGKIPIICVYTAYRPLVNGGVKPDFVVSCDASQMIYEKEDSNQPLDVPLLYFAITQTDLLKRHRGPKIYMNSQSFSAGMFLFDALSLPADKLTGGGSVVHQAMDFARHAGFAKIIFVGLDLAVYGNETHARGSFYSDIEPFETDKIDQLYFRVKGSQGGHVYTTPVLFGFLNWIQQFIGIYKRIEFIDATEGGALIAGTRVMNLRQAIDQCRSELSDIDSTIGRCFAEGPLITGEPGGKAASVFEKLCYDLRELDRLCSEAVPIVNSLAVMRENPSARLERLNELDAEIGGHGFALAILDFAVSSYLLAMDYFDKCEGAEDDMFILDKNRYFYNSLKGMLKETIPLAEAALAVFSSAALKA